MLLWTGAERRMRLAVAGGRGHWLGAVALCLLALIVTRQARADATAASEDSVLVLGRISDDPRSHHEPLRSILDYVVPRMAAVGIREGRVLMARDAQQMASYLRRGRVDWVTETAATGLLLGESSGAEPLVITERDGVALYHSVIFVRGDSGIRDLAGLRGRSIAFQNPNSTSAFYAPAAALLAAGLPLEILLSPQDRPSARGVGFVFAQSESNISTWVQKRLVDAGAFSDIDWRNLSRLPQSFRDDLLVIHSTGEFPRGLELVRSDLPAARKQALQRILLQAKDDPAAAEPLRRFFRTNGFAPIEGAVAEALQQTRSAARRVREAVE